MFLPEPASPSPPRRSGSLLRWDMAKTEDKDLSVPICSIVLDMAKSSLQMPELGTGLFKPGGCETTFIFCDQFCLSVGSSLILQCVPVYGPQEGLKALWISQHRDKSALEKCCHPVFISPANVCIQRLPNRCGGGKRVPVMNIRGKAAIYSFQVCHKHNFYLVKPEVSPLLLIMFMCAVFCVS